MNNNNKKENIFVELTMTNNCNCHCKYCFEGDHPLEERNLEEEQRQFDLLIDLCKKFDINEYEWLTISFWGGEPFLNTDFMFKIINATYKYKFVRYHIYSNGTLEHKYEEFLKQDFISELKGRIHIQLSYDGEPHHSLKRGDNSYKIFNVARMIKQSQLISFDFKATLSFDMIKYLPEIWKSYEKLYKEFGNAGRYHPTLDTTFDSLEYYDEWKNALQKIIIYEYAFIKKYKQPLWSWFSGSSKINCMLGNSIFIHNDGNIYICHGCAYKNENTNLKIKNTKDIKSLTEVISKQYQFDKLPDECINCCATICTICHIMNIMPTENPYDMWLSCRIQKVNRCQYFKQFGIMSNKLKYLCMK